MALEVGRLLDGDQRELLAEWSHILRNDGLVGSSRINEAELQTQCRDFLGALRHALTGGGPVDTQSDRFAGVRDLLGDISRDRALQGSSSSETATFVFALKRPLFERARQALSGSADALAEGFWAISELLDQLGLYTTEVHLKSREEVVARQQEEISELSTPVVKLWDGILALPLIGTLDSGRTQVIMETLLQAIIDQGADIAIIDITGVPTVDTLVAQHLLKTVAAARLMGADCIVSGIRPQIAQTMVHLGVELNVVSKASLADALALALQRTGRSVVRSKAAATPARSTAAPARS